MKRPLLLLLEMDGIGWKQWREKAREEGTGDRLVSGGCCAGKVQIGRRLG